MMHGFFNGSTWSGFVDNWGGVCKNLSSVSWGNERMDIVTVGTDNQVHHFWYQNGPIGWEGLGGGPAGVVAITSQGFGKIDVFAVRTSDRNIYRLKYDQGWGTWHAITTGGGFATTEGSLDATSWGNQRIDVVAVKTNGAVQQVWTPNNGTNWFSNELVGAVPAKSYATTATWGGTERLDVVFNHTGTKLRRMSYEGGWGPHQNAYSSSFAVGLPDLVARPVNHGGMTDVDGVMNMVFAVSGSWFVGTAVR
jgi:hypothetical protein